MSEAILVASKSKLKLKQIEIDFDMQVMKCGRISRYVLDKLLNSTVNEPVCL